MRPRRLPLEAQRPAGGLIAIGGPPLGGKSLLAARLADSLAFAVRLEALDDLGHRGPIWVPDGPGGRVVRNPTRALLARAKEVWESRHPARAPTILVTTRFATPGERRRAQRMAISLGMRFLFVEACSRHARALRRIPIHRLSPEEMRRRLGRYQAALRSYAPVDGVEARRLPAVRFTRVQSRLEEAASRVLGAWQR